MTPIQTLKALEKLYQEKDAIDKKIAEMAKTLVTGTEKSGKITRTRSVKKQIAAEETEKKPRGRKPKQEKVIEPEK